MSLLMILQFEPESKDYSSLLVQAAIAIVVVFLLPLFAHRYEDNKCQKQLLPILTAKGNTDIVLINTSPIFSKHGQDYDVEYTDSNGQRHKNACKVSASKDIYWKNPI